MGNRIIRFIFFSNYFVGLLAVALTIEATLQLRIPFNSPLYFLFLFIAPTVYYTYAYNKGGSNPSSTNLRAIWYHQNRKQVHISQIILFSFSVFLGICLSYKYRFNILSLPAAYWFALVIIALSGLLYYGLLPRSFIGFNLRNTGWIKAFVIGFVWACCVTILPLIMLRIEIGFVYHDPILWTWLFIKNWMFCTVNAIMFDIKDYPSDANRHLRTFVVRFGLRRTIFYILIPLSSIGLISLCFFGYCRHFTVLQVFFNTLPFLLTIYLAYKMHKRRSILFYLMIIDGLILFKAICGIIGMYFKA